MSDPHFHHISQRLSLRPPQAGALEVLTNLAGALELAPGSTRLPREEALRRVQETLEPTGVTFQDFDREFSSLCFELATGVGKTRLMGAFIAWLHLAKGLKHFFVLAPGLTVYEKLLQDFTPNTPKYVFRGLAEFATDYPRLITADNYEEYRGQEDLYSKIEINIFNIDKLRRDVGSGRGQKDDKKASSKMRSLMECLGQSYFDYLKDLPDLVLLMDESHRYRADAGVKALNELNPLLGLELTATAYVEQGKKERLLFNNVAYRYNIAQALADGFIKEPAVVTQRDFNPANFDAEGLERFKLEDGIRLHEATKVELETYALQTGRHKVKPFVLVVARQTEHAAALLKIMESPEFFGGAYAGKVIRVDSMSKDEEVERRLLAVEDPAEPTEIVIHVNMLKEGWDVTNLYTIIPLRPFDARTLIEQTLGRGLRLPYGKRTGVEPVDRLSVVAHDRFKEIVDEANKPGSPLKLKQIILDTKPGGQMVTHLRSYLPDEDALMNVLRYYEISLANNIHAQMQPHFWEKASRYVPKLAKGWMDLKETAFTAEEGQEARPFRSVLEKASLIQRCVFTGFRKCLYTHQKFQSNTERLLTEILEDSPEVEKWFKPVRKQFQIFYRLGIHRDEKLYEPDFVVETTTQKLVIEIKGSANIAAPEVEAKRDAAVAFCEAATQHETSHGGKPWSYVLIPHDYALPNSTLAALVGKF